MRKIEVQVFHSDEENRRYSISVFSARDNRCISVLMFWPQNRGNFSRITKCDKMSVTGCVAGRIVWMRAGVRLALRAVECQSTHPDLTAFPRGRTPKPQSRVT